VRMPVPSFSAGSRPSSNVACLAITTAKTPSSQSSTPSWRALPATTCAEKPLSLPCPALPYQRHLRYRPYPNRTLRDHRSPFPFLFNAVDRGRARLPPARSRVHRSPPLRPHHRLAHSPQYAATPLRNTLQPDFSHLPLPPPRPLSLLPRAHLSHRRHMVHPQPRWIGVLRNIGWRCKDGRRK